MGTGYRDFCKKIKERDELKTDKTDRRITFSLYVHEHYGLRWNFDSGRELFTLDNEDLIYLFNKYSPKVLEELEQNITEIKKTYENITTEK